MQNILEAILLAQSNRSWCKENLPVEESVVAYDLIMLLAIKFAKQEPINVKQIYILLPHSYTAVRQHYIRLKNDGWIESTGDEKDARVKYITPTSKFTELINSYAKFLTSNVPNDTLRQQ